MDILTVAEFNKVLNSVFSELGEFSVQGEIVSMKITANRAVFIDLKDKKENAILKISNFAPWVEGLNSVQEGMDVIVSGALEVYSPYGTMTLKARKVEPVGEGSLKIASEKLKLLLNSEGLFAPERKRPLPQFVTRIALITAKDSAAFADFTKIIAENGAAISIDFYPVLVQGASSSNEISAALHNVGKQGYDVVCLIRGGGSLEDLQSFNSELVARAIFASATPLICGVGHEVDTTIADMVADVRASTPSQAAYYLVSQNNSFLQGINTQLQNQQDSLRGLLPAQDMIGRLQRILLENISQHYSSSTVVDSKVNNLNLAVHKLYKYLSDYGASLKSPELIQQNILAKVKLSQAQVGEKINLIGAYNPGNVLKRGYTLIKKQQKYISSVEALNIGDKLEIIFKDGSVESAILGRTHKLK